MEKPEFSLKFDGKANVWVSYAHDEKLYTQGRTAEESVKAIQSAVLAYHRVKGERAAKRYETVV